MKNKCSVEDCENCVRSKNCGYCQKHYYRMRRNKTMKLSIYNYTFNKDAFLKINNQQAWFLGLLWSDGNISRNRVSIRSKDKQMLILAEKAINGSGLIVPVQNGKYWDLRFNDKIISDRLRSFGLIQNKSLTVEWPINFPKQRVSSFIRGVFDGDGHVVTKNDNGKRRTIGAGISSASKSFAYSLSEVLNDNGICNSVYFKKNAYNGIYNISIHNKKSLQKFARFIYDNDGGFYLERKKTLLSCERISMLKTGRKNGLTLSLKQQEKIIAIFMSNGNMSISKTALISSRCQNVIARVLKNNNVSIIKGRSRIKRMTKQDILNIKKLRLSLSFKQIQEQTGFTRHMIRYAIRL